MNVMLKLNKKTDYILLAIAVVAVLIPLYAYTAQYPTFILTYILFGVVSCGTPVLLMMSQKAYRNKTEPIWKPMLYRGAIILLPIVYGIAAWNEDEWWKLLIVIIAVLAPTVVAMLIIQSCREKGLSITRKIWIYIVCALVRWIILEMVCFVAFFSTYNCLILDGALMIILMCIEEKRREEINDFNQRRIFWGMLNYSFIMLYVIIFSHGSAYYQEMLSLIWHPLLTISLTFLLPAYYRFLSGGESPEKLRIHKTWAYFGGCLMLYIFSTSVIYVLYNYLYLENMLGNPLLGTYYIFLSILVYWLERRGETDKESGKAGNGIAACVIFAAVCVLLSIAMSERTREIIFHLGGPKIGIEKTERMDWLGYKLSTIDLFFSGNMDLIISKYGKGYFGFERVLYGSGLKSVLYHSDKLILALICAVLTALSVLLIVRRTGDKRIDRIGIYIGMGYFIRTAIYMLMTITMTVETFVILPFAMEGIADLALLIIFLSMKTMPEMKL